MNAPSRTTAAGLSDRAVRTVDGWARRVERAPWLSFLALSVVYWWFTWHFAARKLMWNDELYTFYMATLPTMRDVWAALMARGEQTPPLFYFLTRLSMRAVGDINIAIRLPEMLATWVMSACVFVAVRRRTSTLPAVCAAAFPLVTTVYPYAFEARAYGLMLGFASLAFVSWQTATMRGGRMRVVGVCALALSLAGTLTSHYYGIFALLPLALGEGVRDVQRRRLDVAIWAAFALSVLPLLGHIELIRAGAEYTGAFWSPPQWVNVPDFYSDLLAPAVIPALGILLVGTLFSTLWIERSSNADITSPRPPAFEVVAALAFVAIPVMCVVVAKLATGAFVNRYALTAVIGFALLAGFGVSVWFRRNAAMRLIAAGIVAGWFVLGQAREVVNATGSSIPVSQASIDKAAEWVQRAGQPDLPVVVADPHTFAVLSHYAPPDLRARIVYLADPDRALHYLGHNSVERGMLDLLKPWFGMNVVPFEPYVQTHPRFLLYGDFWRRAFLNWMLPELQARGMHVELLQRSGDDMLLLVSP